MRTRLWLCAPLCTLVLVWLVAACSTTEKCDVGLDTGGGSLDAQAQTDQYQPGEDIVLDDLAGADDTAAEDIVAPVDLQAVDTAGEDLTAPVDVVEDTGPPPRDIRVLVTLRDEPVVDQVVYFQRGLSFVAIVTDESGVALFETDRPTHVTINEEGGTSCATTTYLEVPPGTDLHHRLSARGGPPSDRITFNLSGTVEGAAEYFITTGCGGASLDAEDGPDFEVRYYASCVAEMGSFDVLAIALDEQQAPLAWVSATGIEQPPAGPVLLGPWQENFTNKRISLSNGFTPVSLSTDLNLVSRGRDYLVPFDWELGLGGGLGSGETLVVDLPVPPDFAANDQFRISAATPNGARVSYQAVGPVAAAVNVDFAEGMLPQVPEAGWFVPGGGERPLLYWLTTGDMGSADAMRIDMNGSTTVGFFSWAVYAPGDLPDGLTVPGLPDALAACVPDGDVDPQARFFDVDSIRGYGAFLDRFGNAFPDLDPSLGPDQLWQSESP